ncbi:hypothetical protein IQ254_07985 [Nodosilinea sp. LEGE 07088]|uniref:DUF6624 domain-containing protein n=1 Tax=Nodosilinea sp. LEGE 07088 TaxID=2777968 RepID=UPI00188278D5|nr:DUF6624 domain-containing protein [Nodosilinea sp. LEGE 07088]MBE9137143.1 hypothetical protein [Nodosilinea sp. LEGE 07088]
MDNDLLKQLELLKKKDTDTRNKLLEEGELYGTYHEAMRSVHRENAIALDKIIEEHGWPGISKVGLEGSRAAWLIAQHSICTPALQRKFLDHLSNAEKQGDVPGKQVALLTDRIRFNEGRPQVYGTVLDWNETGELTCEVEDEENIDQLREQVGLPLFQQSLHHHRLEVEAEGGNAPEDFRVYKQASDDWAKSVGWR